MFTSDYKISFFIGFLVALFLTPTLILAHVPATLFVVIASFIIFPVGAVAGFWVFSILARKKPVFTQISKFAIAGFSNFAIDSGVLSIVSLLTSITKGGGLAPANLPGFIAAVCNSYYWNKYWTFKDTSEKKDHHDFLSFLAVTIFGFFINTGAVIILTTYIGPLGGVSEQRWLIVAKLGATVINLVWNFLGLKFVVFKKKQDTAQIPSAPQASV